MRGEVLQATSVRKLVLGQDDLLEAMEEGAMETRRSLRLLKLVHGRMQSGGALIYVLPHSEAADSSSMRAAAHKTSRIVDQQPLRHGRLLVRPHRWSREVMGRPAPLRFSCSRRARRAMRVY